MKTVLLVRALILAPMFFQAENHLSVNKLNEFQLLNVGDIWCSHGGDYDK
jgi:hypothetical protein